MLTLRSLLNNSGKEVELAPEYMTLEFREMSKVETNLRRLVRRMRKEVCEKEAK